MKKNNIRKFKKKEKYVKLSNESMQNDKLSFGARGLLAYILSLPEDWTLYVTDLYNRSPQGRAAIDRMIKELKEAGHLVKLLHRNTKGQLIGTSWLAFDERETEEDITEFIEEEYWDEDLKNIKVELSGNTINIDFSPNVEKPTTGKPSDGKPVDGKPASTNKTNTKETKTKKTPTKSVDSAPLSEEQKKQVKTSLLKAMKLQPIGTAISNQYGNSKIFLSTHLYPLAEKRGADNVNNALKMIYSEKNPNQVKDLKGLIISKL